MDNSVKNTQLMSYLLGISPLVIAQLMIPPLSYFLGERVDISIMDEIYLHITPPALLDFKFLRSLMFDGKNMKEDQWFTIFSYMFVHGDYNHLFNNLRSLCLVSLPVFQSFGSFGVYSIFFGGGIAAIAPSSLRETQSSNQPLHRRLLNRVVSVVFPPKCCGSSGGVFGLLGARNAIEIFQFVKYVKNINRKIQRERQSSRSRARSLSYPQAFSEVFFRELDLQYLILSLFQITATVLTVKSQIDSAKKGGDANIDNAGHVQGFFFGAALATLFQCFKSQ